MRESVDMGGGGGERVDLKLKRMKRILFPPTDHHITTAIFLLTSLTTPFYIKIMMTACINITGLYRRHYGQNHPVQRNLNRNCCRPGSDRGKNPCV